MIDPQERIVLLARQKNTIFHTKDLGVLWAIRNPNTLYTLLKRYTQKKLLFRIFKGLYSLLPIEKTDPFLLGLRAVHDYGYISTETVLAEQGIIPQFTHAITIMSSKSMKFTIGKHHFISRQLKTEFLLNPVGIQEKEGVKIATPERAVADLLYFNPKSPLDGSEMIDFKKIKTIQKEIGYPLTPRRYTHFA